MMQSWTGPVNHPSKLTRSLGIAFFSFGILAGTLFFALLSWARLEAFFYFDYVQAEKTLTTLNCPFVLTTGEQGQVSVTYTNPANRTVSPQIMTEISSPGLFRTINTTPTFAAGETKRLQWTVTSQDVVFGYLTLAEVYVSPVYGATDQDATCGILWVDLPELTGSEIFAGVLAASLLCVTLGWGLWTSGRGPLQGGGREVTRAMLALTSVVLLGMIAGVFGSWLLGVICLGFTVLLVVSILGYTIQRF